MDVLHSPFKSLYPLTKTKLVSRCNSVIMNTEIAEMSNCDFRKRNGEPGMEKGGGALIRERGVKRRAMARGHRRHRRTQEANGGALSKCQSL